MQNCEMPPFVNWAEAWSTQMVDKDVCFWPQPKEIELIDLSFFWSSPNFGQKIGPNLSEVFF